MQHKEEMMQWSCPSEPDFYCQRACQLVALWDECINVVGIILKNKDTTVEFDILRTMHHDIFL